VCRGCAVAASKEAGESGEDQPAQGVDMEVLSINPFWMARMSILLARSSRFKTRSSPSYALRIPIGLPRLPR